MTIDDAKIVLRAMIAPLQESNRGIDADCLQQLLDKDDCFEEQVAYRMREHFAAHAPPYPFALPQVSPYREVGAEVEVAQMLVRWNLTWADAMIAALRRKIPRCYETVPPYWNTLLECTSETCNRPLPCSVHRHKEAKL